MPGRTCLLAKRATDRYPTAKAAFWGPDRLSLMFRSGISCGVYLRARERVDLAVDDHIGVILTPPFIKNIVFMPSRGSCDTYGRRIWQIR